MERYARVGNVRLPLGEWWDGWVGSQTPAEFLHYSTPGLSLTEQVAEYVVQLEAQHLLALLEPEGLADYEEAEPADTFTVDDLRAELTDALAAYLYFRDHDD